MKDRVRTTLCAIFDDRGLPFKAAARNASSTDIS
jgi:hypothetical protein